VVSQWVWNLRLELGHQLEPTSLRITEFAPAIPEQSEQAHLASFAPSSGYGPPTTATRLGKRVASPAQIFLFNPMGPCAVPQAIRSRPRSDVMRKMGACAWCMRPASASVARVPCANSANGKAGPPKSRAR
jgi:hypothetical protein